MQAVVWLAQPRCFQTLPDQNAYAHHVTDSIRNRGVPGSQHVSSSGRTLQFWEGWHSSENAVRFWTPSPRVPKEADARCYAFTTAYATMIPLCNVFCVQSNTPTPSHT